MAGIEDEFEMGPGQSGLFSGAEATRGVMECPARRRVLFAEVAFSPPMLLHLLAGGAGPSALADGSPDGTFMRLTETTRQATPALRQMLDCSYGDAARRIYLEAKATELMALHLAEPTVEERASNGIVLRLDDIERIHEARRVLDANLENPPSLVELSRRVGLNDFKLKAGFKQVYGTTAFGHLHEGRMQEARRLVEMNVGEVALAVGYSSPSRFAAAFKRRFGVRPSSLLPRNGSQRHPSPSRVPG